jgi:hypothetical protein
LQRSYAVVAQTQKPYDTSSQKFHVNSTIEQKYKRAAYEEKLLQLLDYLRPYKVDSSVIEAGNKILNKEYKLHDLIPKGAEYDLTPYFEGLTQIEADDMTLSTLFGKDWKQIVEDFTGHTPYLTPLAMDSILALNSEGYTKIKAKRAEAILKWCKEHASEVQAGDKQK